MVTSELGACEWFVWDLRRSNLLDRGRLDQIVGEFLSRNPRAEPPALAEFLVGQGILTDFQAERLLQGKTQGFVLGPFVLMDALGAGSMGTVYKAQSKNDGNWYAVKVLPRRSMWNVRVARRKVRAFESCKHPAVVPFVDVGTSGGMHYLAWPLVEGETLEKYVQTHGKLPPHLAASFAKQIAEGLDVCHQQDLIHGLVKPSNLMVCPETGQISILDFGIGCLLAETEGESLVDTMSTANSVTSGLDCASPESIMEPTNLTPQGDQYSLGCTLYFMLTGQYPFPDGTAAEKMMAHQLKQPTPVTELSPDAPPGLCEVVNKLLAKIPEQRFGSAHEVVDALSPFVSRGAAGPAANTDARLRPATPKPGSGTRPPSPGLRSAVMPPPNPTSTPSPQPGLRSGVVGGIANPATPKPPSTPLPRVPQPPAGLPVRSPSSVPAKSSRPVTMAAVSLPSRGINVPSPAAPVFKAPSGPPTEVAESATPAEDAIPVASEAPKRLDERVGPLGLVLITTLVCCAVFFAINYFKLL
jgi:serine/threonine protein kinase